MIQSIYKVLSNSPIANTIYQMVLEGDTSSIRRPGQFINIKIEGLFLRRPISICDYNDSTITIIYKVVGKGTEILSNMKNTDKLDILVGLGNGYDTTKAGKKPLLLGGGVGIPPLFKLTKTLISEGKSPMVVLGYKNKEESFYINEFKNIGAKVIIATEDGSLGIKGFVIDAIKDLSDYTYFYTCGPEAMLKAVSENTSTEGQLSFEERMGCGFGACMGCSCETKYESKRICKEGPILEKEEILW